MDDDNDVPIINQGQLPSQESATYSSRTRRKTDPGWDHVSLRKEGNINVYTCLYCKETYRGGGINRMKQHLAGVPGQISSCKKVNHDLRHKMKELLQQCRNKDAIEELNEVYNDEEDGHQEYNICSSKRQVQRKSVLDDSFFAPRSTPGSQPSLKSVLSTKEAQHKAKLAVAKWMYDACIPFHAVESHYFRQAVDAIAAIGPGFTGPSYYELRFNLLGDCKRECQLLVDDYKSSWAKTGCTIMADGWTDQRQQTLVNFLVYCTTGTIFVKSINASDVVKDARTICEMISEVIEWVGPLNVVHVVTDNAANYVAAGKLIHEKYNQIYWSPCATHCLNLLLKDIGSLSHVADLASKASKTTVFVYNHMIFLSWLRKREGWKEIVRPGATRFATTFITLKSIYDHKHELQALVLDKHFINHRLAQTAPGKLFADIILDSRFWKGCYAIINIVAPIIRLLRIMDSDEKPSLGYIYEGMQRAKSAIKEMFKNKKNLYEPYVEIIKAQWDKHLKRDLHAVAYFLNPQFFYDDNFREKNRLMQSLLDLLDIESNCTNLTQAIQELQTYRERKGSFGRESAHKVIKSIRPDQWWSLYGGSAPILQRLAIRLLSQTSSSSGCERNWSLFGRIHTKRRNRLEHQRLSDLIFVSYNLRLKNRLHSNKRSYDPIDYESIDKVDIWIAEEDPVSEFNDQDEEMLDNFIYEDNAIPVVGETRQGEGETERDVANMISEDTFEASDIVGTSIDSNGGGIGSSLGTEALNLNDCYD